MMSKWLSFLNGAGRGAANATLAFSVVVAGTALLSANTSYAASKRALFVSAAQCRSLNDDNLATCCGALNRGAVMSAAQLHCARR